MKRNFPACLLIFGLTVGALNSCSGGLELNFDSSLTVNGNAYESVAPTGKMDSSPEPFRLPADDWVAQARAGVDEPLLAASIDGARELALSQTDKTKFSAWSAQPLLSLINSAYLLTENPGYLDEFAWFYDYFLGVRMDRQNRADYTGKIKPQWERLDHFNILGVSPYVDYSGFSPDELLDLRGWNNLYFSDVNYSGLYIEQMLRFAQIIKRNDLSEFAEIADDIILESVKVVESHEREWVQAFGDEGYYIFPKGCPFFLDGVEMPINEAAIFGTALVRLYFLTGDDRWLERALDMWKHWKGAFSADEYGYITYPYVLGSLRNGWTSENSPSVNTPDAPAIPDHEAFHKAALTIQFLTMIEKARPGSVRDYLMAFRRVMSAVQRVGGTPISEYPGAFGFHWPTNTVNTIPPFYSEGWIGLMHDDRAFQSSLRRYDAARGNAFLSGALYGNLLEEDQTSGGLITRTETLRPDLMEEEAGDCMIFGDQPAVAELRFFHTSPKDNRLYLYVDKSPDRKIRLDPDAVEGGFKGNMFIPAGACIFLSWFPESEFSYPADDIENQIFLTRFMLDEK